MAGAFVALMGGAIAIASNHETAKSHSHAHRASQEAVKAAGGGVATSVDQDSEKGAAWEVEVTKADGSRVDVLLDDQFRVINAGAGRDPNDSDSSNEDSNDTESTGPDSEQPLRRVQCGSRGTGGAEGDGRWNVDRDRERDATWEVEVMKLDGTSTDVLLDDQFRVIDVGGEREPGEPESHEGSDDGHEDHD